MTAQNSATLDPASPVPLYQQLFLLLRDQINGGALRPGQKIMGEADLCLAYDVSRITAKRALNELADTGLVVRQRGRGTRVSDRLPPRPMKSSIDGLLETVGQMGRDTSVKVLFTGLRPVPADVAAQLDLKPGEEALQTQRVRALGDQPVSYLDAWVPSDIGARIMGQEPSQVPVLIQLEQAGVAVSSATQTISATLADATSAQALGVPMGAPLIDSRRVVFDAEDRPVEVIRVLYRPEMYQYEISMRRVQGDNGRAWIPGTPAAVPQG
ncbi:GntR family transcriptional regulator [Pseudooceanicola marinus]|uniref:GntR family transcriptional regulator n=1 Tax=Pseudooceanicola marinus TaxID=396013 RepID=UPI001C947B7F|nr:GntR family transcriptional regulator [Pseudooceanicola marinus]MBY5973375.1 GntR family transcriptional regulator [Ferrimonas balearica]MCA1336380.1 GntR family transcriptional regulator [Pseudooceanicola marinus]